MKNIVLVGCGGIGSRHLQGLSQIKREVNISVVDPSNESIKIAQSRYNEMPKNQFIKSINFYESLEKINFDIDLAIIATNSDERKGIIIELFSRANVKYLIL